MSRSATRIVVFSLAIVAVGLLTLTVALAVVWLPPAINGYHLGYNSATDNACETWVGLQFCRHQSSAVAPVHRRR